MIVVQRNQWHGHAIRLAKRSAKSCCYTPRNSAYKMRKVGGNISQWNNKHGRPLRVVKLIFWFRNHVCLTTKPPNFFRIFVTCCYVTLMSWAEFHNKPCYPYKLRRNTAGAQVCHNHAGQFLQYEATPLRFGGWSLRSSLMRMPQVYSPGTEEATTRLGSSSSARPLHYASGVDPCGHPSTAVKLVASLWNVCRAKNRHRCCYQTSCQQGFPKFIYTAYGLTWLAYMAASQRLNYGNRLRHAMKMNIYSR